VNTVREDPVRKGLLYAGTELAVFVSFDDGENWTPLRLNMPAISIRDLVVHGQDLVVGTHGRGFWILDDVSPLREMSAEIAGADAHLFQTGVAYRMRRNNNTDTPLPPEEPAGENPPDGAIVYYHLKSAATAPITIEIFDATKKLVRRYASDDKPEPIDPALNVPTYWLRPTAIPEARDGMHRFVWDLHYAPPDALSHEYPISAIYRDTPRYPLGASVMPGVYTVKLTVDGKSYTQPLTVKMDPRVKTPPAGLQQQFTLSTKVTDMMHRDYEALQEVKDLRAKHPELEQDAAALAGSGGGRFGRGASGESLSKLNGDLAAVLAVLQGADAAPTTQAVKAVSELERQLNDMLAKTAALKAKAR
jgi:hypothetical protein